MAEIYQKIVDVDNCLILEPRQAVQRRLASQFVDDWNEIRMGMFWSITQSADDNAIPAASESVTNNSRLDMPFFGLKNWYDLGETTGDPNEIAPGFAGSLFVGKGPVENDAQMFKSAPDYWSIKAVTGDTWPSCGFYNATSKATNPGVGPAVHCPYDISGDTLYAGFCGFGLNITNRGLATQQINITDLAAPAEQSYYTDVSANHLRELLAQTPGGGHTQNLLWNDGAVAYQVPDSIYMRLPFYAIRLRIHALGVLKISPT